MKMNTKKIILGLNLTLLPLASITTVISCKKKVEPKIDLVKAKSLGFDATPGSEKPEALNKNRTKSQSEKYNAQMKKYNADQLAQEQAAVSSKTIAKGFGFASTKGSEKPKDLTGTPTKDQIDTYNTQMKKYNADQLEKSNNAKSTLIKANDLGYPITVGKEKPSALGNNPTKNQIETYNSKMTAYNADQVEKSNNAKSTLIKANDLGYPITTGKEKPSALGDNPTKNQIETYNSKMTAYNADQVEKSNNAKSTLIKANDLGYPITTGKEKPSALGDNPTKNQIETYNSKMIAYNADQVEKYNNAKSTLVKASDLGYPITTGKEKPSALGNKPTKNQIETYNSKMTAYNADQLAQSSKAKSTLISAIDKNFTPTKGMEKPATLTEAPTKGQIDAYNAQMVKYNTDQNNQYKEALNYMRQKHDRGFGSAIVIPDQIFTKSDIDVYNLKVDEFNRDQVAQFQLAIQHLHEKDNKGFSSTIQIPTTIFTKSDIDVYNLKVDEFNNNQLVQLGSVNAKLVQAIILKLPFTSTVGMEKPVIFIKKPKQPQIDAYNAQMVKYNEDQLAQSRKARSTLILAINKNFTPTEGMEKPAVIHGLGIILLNKDQIDAYNAQMEKYNADQLAQSRKAKFALVKAKNLGFDKPTKGNEKPVIHGLGTILLNKDQIDAYNAQMEKYNADQIAQSRKAESALIKAKNLGFDKPTKGNEKPVIHGLGIILLNKDQIVAYNAQMVKYNTDQNNQYKEALNYMRQKHDRGFGSAIVIPDQIFTKSDIDVYNLKVDEFNRDQVAQFQLAIQHLHEKDNKGFSSTIKIPTTIFTKSDIDVYNLKVDEFNNNQLVQLGRVNAKLVQAIILKSPFTSTVGMEKPIIFTKKPKQPQIDAYNAQMVKHNADQLAQLNKAKSTLISAIDKNFTPTKGMEKPAVIHGLGIILLNKDQIDAYNAQMKKYNADQFVQSLIIANLNEIDFSKGLIKAKNLGFEKPTKGNKKPTHNQYFETLKVNQDDLNEKSILEIYDYIKSYNAQMEKYNADQLAQENIALDGIVKAKGLEFTSTQGNEMPAPLTGTPTKDQIDAYNAQMEKYNADQIAQENIALDGIVKPKGLEFTSTQGNEMPAPLTGTPTKDQIDAYNAQMEKYNADQLVQSSKAKSTLILAINKNFTPTKGMEKPAVIHGLGIILLNKDQIDAYNAQMEKYNADQFVQSLIIANLNEIDFSKGLINAKNLGFEKPTKGNKKPTHNQYFETLKVNQDDLNEKSILEIYDYIKSYNAQMEKYNADQLVQSSKAKSTLIEAKDLGYVSSEGSEWADKTSLPVAPTKDQIDAYNVQMKKFNANQSFLSSIAKERVIKSLLKGQNLIKAKYLGFVSTEGNENPFALMREFLGHNPTASEIKERMAYLVMEKIDYNTQMAKYNVDQLAQENIALDGIVKAKGLEFTSTQGNEMPAPLTGTPTKDQIDAYNVQMKKFNANQSFLSSIAKERVIKSLLKGQNLIKAKYLGFVSTEGNENPFALIKEFLGHNPTAWEIKGKMAGLIMEKIDYNTQMAKYNADQLAQLAKKKINEIISSLKVTTSTNKIY